MSGNVCHHAAGAVPSLDLIWRRLTMVISCPKFPRLPWHVDSTSHPPIVLPLSLSFRSRFVNFCRRFAVDHCHVKALLAYDLCRDCLSDFDCPTTPDSPASLIPVLAANLRQYTVVVG